MSPPPLNDDVLRHILSYLHGRDALHAALCSKRMRDLALPRVPVLAHVRSPDDLRRTCAYMLAGTQPRAHFLEDLLIDLQVFDYPKHEDAQAPLPASDYWDFSQAPLIGDLLAHAPRLRALELERLHPLFVCSSSSTLSISPPVSTTIFAATEAKSGASTQRGAQSLSLLSLNDDVLSEIVFYLRDIDAINVAHSSKRLYCLAIAAVLRVVRCKDLVQLARFHRCMLSGPESSKSRAHHLRALLVGTWSPYYRPIGYRDELTIDTDEGELAHLDGLFAILGVALHLRRLSWVGASWDPDLLDHLGYSARLRTALASLSNLRDLELSQVTDREVAALPSLPTLEVFTLTYQMARWTVDFSTTPYVIPPPHLILRTESGRWATYDMALTRGFQSCSVLIEALRRMPRLRELALCNFYPGEAVESLVREPWYLGASFPTVSKLSLLQVAASSILLIDLFSGLSHLFVDILEPERRGHAVVQPVITTSRRWPPLQSLSITTRDLELCGIERLNTVRTLYSRDLSSHDAKVQPGSFVRALSHLSPVHITRHWRFLVEEYLTPACGFWTGLHAYPPGLRSLDLVVWAKHNCIENAWHRIVPRKLAGLALAEEERANIRGGVAQQRTPAHLAVMDTTIKAEEDRTGSLRLRRGEERRAAAAAARTHAHGVAESPLTRCVAFLLALDEADARATPAESHCVVGTQTRKRSTQQTQNEEVINIIPPKCTPPSPFTVSSFQ
ncbi:hypothetical protein BN946_scf184939.g10 [Trametes cinnabarina]|uniref:F-box domain-containing protein n=1 Tax=Pycnoporus cinnabarinus TaxID=5643 RepID=A0A060SC64_PYCCI|nr:hypothetical protein BN946_scf184939.g10 [Trametes cinnabarina]